MDLQTKIINLLISLLDSKVVLTLESHISLSWKIQSMLTYTLRFPMPPVNFLAPELTIVLCGRCLSFRLYVQQFLVLMTTSSHKTTCTQFCEHRPPPHWSWHQKMFTYCVTLFTYFILIMFFYTYRYLHCVCKWHFDIKIGFTKNLLKNPTFEIKLSYYHWIMYDTSLRAQACHIKGGEQYRTQSFKYMTVDHMVDPGSSFNKTHNPECATIECVNF